MKTFQKIKEIKKLRSQGLSFAVIGKQMGVTSEWIRQLLTPRKQKFCRKHKRHYLNSCLFCQRENSLQKDYFKRIKRLKNSILMKEIVRLSKPDRHHSVAIQRAHLVKVLYDKYDFSFPEIGYLLNQHYTSAIASYYRKLK